MKNSTRFLLVIVFLLVVGTIVFALISPTKTTKVIESIKKQISANPPTKLADVGSLTSSTNIQLAKDDRVIPILYQENLKLRATGDPAAGISATVPPGTKGTILAGPTPGLIKGVNIDYYSVQFDNGTTGWANGIFLKKIGSESVSLPDLPPISSSDTILPILSANRLFVADDGNASAVTHYGTLIGYGGTSKIEYTAIYGGVAGGEYDRALMAKFDLSSVPAGSKVEDAYIVARGNTAGTIGMNLADWTDEWAKIRPINEAWNDSGNWMCPTVADCAWKAGARWSVSTIPHNPLWPHGRGGDLSTQVGEPVALLNFNSGKETRSLDVERSYELKDLVQDWVDGRVANNGVYFDSQTNLDASLHSMIPFDGMRPLVDNPSASHPNVMQVGIDKLELHAVLSGGNPVTPPVTPGTNHTPVADNQSVSVNQGVAKPVTLVASDADSNSLTYSIVSQPAHGTLSGTAPNLTYTPTASYSGSDSFTFKVYDGVAYSNVATVSITVSAPASSIWATAGTRVQVSYKDGVYIRPTADSSTSLGIATLGTQGTVLNGPTVVGGYERYNVTWNTSSGIVTGWSALRESSGSWVGVSFTSTPTNPVTPGTNRVPVANNQSVSASQGVSKTVTLSASDPDGNSLTYSIVSQPAHGTLSGTGQNLTYTSATGYSGSDSFTFKAYDGVAYSNVATVSITVNPVDQPRIVSGLLIESLLGNHVNPPNYTGAWPAKGQSFTDPTTGIKVTRISDIMDSPRLNGSTGEYACPKGSTTTCLNNPQVGFLNGYSTYTNVNVNGHYAMALGTDSGLFHLYDLTTGAYKWPLYTEKTDPRWDLSGRPGTETTIYLTDGLGIYKADVLTKVKQTVYSLRNDFPSPALIESEDHVDQSTNARYRSIGVDFTYPAPSLPSPTTAPSTGSNHAPSATSKAVSTVQDRNKSIVLSASDVDGNSLTYSVVTQPAHGILTGTASNLVYTPSAGYYGRDSFTFKANDGIDNSNVATISISVNTKKRIVVNLYSSRMLPGMISTPDGGGHEMSPSGDWLFLALPPGMRFYRTSDLAQGITDRYVPFDTVTTYNHYSWSYDKQGNEVLVFLQNGNDKMESFAPATAQMTYIAHFLDFGVGWCLNYHIARIQNPAKKGWFLVSTYGLPNGIACPAGGGNIGWSGNSLFIVEVAPREQNPKIIRVSPTYDLRYIYNPSTGKYDDNGYYTEAFANIDLAGNKIYWGTNWYGTKNLELFMAELPSNWEQVSGSGTPYVPPVNTNKTPPVLHINPPTFSSILKLFTGSLMPWLANTYSSFWDFSPK